MNQNLQEFYFTWPATSTIWLIAGACVLGWIFAFVPTAVFLSLEWRKRFSDIICRFSESAIKLYYRRYLASEANTAGNNLTESFQKQMQSRYGGQRFFLPLFLLILISGIAIALVDISVLSWLGLAPNLTAIPPIAVSAILGAYLWSVSDQIARFGTFDLSPNDVRSWCFRFLIAVPTGYCLAMTVKDDVGIPLAFFLGTFPTNTVASFGRRFVAKKLDIADQPASEKAELELIQGINTPEAERFKESGITTILQLAYIDPIDMTLRTNYGFDYILDCMSQALLWVYLDKSIDIGKLRVLGLRGAYEAIGLYRLLNSTVDDEKQVGQKNLGEIAKVLEVDEIAFKKTLLEVATDPYSVFIYEVFNS